MPAVGHGLRRPSGNVRDQQEDVNAHSQIRKSQRHFSWGWRAIQKTNRAEIMFDVLMNILVILSFGFPAMPWLFLVRDRVQEAFGSVQDLP